MEQIIIIMMSVILVDNFVLSQFLGICPFMGVSKKLDSARGMGMAVTFVMTLATAATWPIQNFLLEPYGIGYLQTLVFILVIASLVQLVEVVLKKHVPTLYKSLGIFLPLITTNCAVLGVAILVIKKDYNLVEGIVYGAATAIGFGLALVILAGIREQLELADIPSGMKGAPIALVTAGILALAFMGFAGLV